MEPILWIFVLVLTSDGVIILASRMLFYCFKVTSNFRREISSRLDDIYEFTAAIDLAWLIAIFAMTDSWLIPLFQHN